MGLPGGRCSAGPWRLSLGTGLLAFTITVARRDYAALPVWMTAGLLLLRLAVIAGIAVICLNPRERTQTIVTRPSRLAILVDTSQSMRDPERTPKPQNRSDEPPLSRSAAIVQLFERSPLLAELRKIHDLHLYTFDRALRQGPILRTDGSVDVAPLAGAPQIVGSAAGGTSKTPAAGNATLDWDQLLEPIGVETRLGESAAELLKSIRGTTLAGLVLFSDGNLNAGLGPEAILGIAASPREPVRIATIGLGGLDRPANLAIVELRAPSEVRYAKEVKKQDPFDIVAFVRADQMNGEAVDIELLRHPAAAAADSATVVDSQHVTLPGDGSTVEVKFTQQPDVAGEFRYVVRARAGSATVSEYRTEDNVREATVTFSERSTSVLLIAGGPTRDYHFLRTMLFRSATTDVDVWLQTVAPAEGRVGESGQRRPVDNFPTRFPGTPDRRAPARKLLLPENL